jgi:hypothetical protein
MGERQDRDSGFEESATRIVPLKMKELIGALEKHEVEYLIVGGWAVVAHGLVRATKDVDICPRSSDENFERLLLALKKIKAKPILGDLDKDHDVQLDMDGLRHGGNWLLLTEYGRLDLMQYLSGPEEQEWGWVELSKHSIVKSLLGYECRFCGYEDLLAMKKAAGRPQDLIDIEGLRQARQ